MAKRKTYVGNFERLWWISVIIVLFEYMYKLYVMSCDVLLFLVGRLQSDKLFRELGWTKNVHQIVSITHSFNMVIFVPH